VVGDGIRRNPFLLPTEFVITLGDPMEDDDLSVAGGGTTSQPLARQVHCPALTFTCRRLLKAIRETSVRICTCSLRLY
jgi:hypothetical protein